MYDDDLTPEERSALQALPRERSPSDLLEQRTVHALHARGLLRVSRSRRMFFPPAWVGAAAAASVALFASGFAFGQWLEGRRTKDVLVALHERDTARAAAMVQQAGSAYIAALGRLADMADSSSTGDLGQGREVAVNVLHAAASQLVRIAPDEPVATRILQGLDRAAERDTTTMAAAEGRRVIWF